jgi:hypothetical protein
MSAAMWNVAYGLGSFLVVVLLSMHGRFKRAQEMLSERPPPWSWWPFYSSFCAVSVLKLKEGKKLESAANALRDVILGNGGRVVYSGTAVRTLVQSKQFGECEYDLLLHTRWDSDEHFKGFLPKLQAMCEWEVVRTQGFHRNAWINLVGINLLMTMLAIKNSFQLAGTYSLDMPATEEDEGAARDSSAPFSLEKLWTEAAMIEASAQPDAPVIVYNWVKDGHAKSNSTYGTQMLSMLINYGGGPMHIGKSCAVQPVEDAGEYTTVVAMHYPNINFITKLFRSAWMYKTVQDKKHEDSLAVLTVPYKLELPEEDEVPTPNTDKSRKKIR